MKLQLTKLLLSYFVLFNVSVCFADDGFKDYWPEKADGTELYPENHKVIYETNEFKIVDVIIPAGTSEQPHTCPYESFLFVDEPAKISIRNLDEKGNEKLVFKSLDSTEKPEDLPFQLVKPEPLNYISNDDTKDYKAIRIEAPGQIPSLAANFIWMTRHNFFDVVPYRVWRTNVANHTKIYTVNEEYIIVANQGSSIEILQGKNGGFNDKFTPVPSLTSSDRPSVWVLQPNSVYELHERSSSDESFYVIPIQHHNFQ